MSVCTFLAADVPLPEVIAPENAPILIDLDRGIIDDGNGDDNFSLLHFADVDLYSSRAWGVSLEWNYYTEGRANRLIAYIAEALQHTACVELNHVWLDGYYEFDERPAVHRKTLRFEDLTAEHIRALTQAPIWNQPDKTYPDRPSFYCLSVYR